MKIHQRNTIMIAVWLMLAACGSEAPRMSSGGAGGDSTTSSSTTSTKGSGGAPPDSGTSCQTEACPNGWYSTCEPGDTQVVCCLEGGTSTACALPAGILHHDCTIQCPSDICATSPHGTETCCAFGGVTTNPCEEMVP